MLKQVQHDEERQAVVWTRGGNGPNPLSYTALACQRARSLARVGFADVLLRFLRRFPESVTLVFEGKNVFLQRVRENSSG
jgi:hypothetical protein